MYQIRIILKICSTHNAALGAKNALFFLHHSECRWKVVAHSHGTHFHRLGYLQLCDPKQPTTSNSSERQRENEKMNDCPMCSFVRVLWTVSHITTDYANLTKSYMYRVSRCTGTHSSTHSQTEKKRSGQTTKIPKRQRQQQFIFRIVLNATIFSVPINFSSSPHWNKCICIHICVHSLIYEILKLNHALIYGFDLPMVRIFIFIWTWSRPGAYACALSHSQYSHTQHTRRLVRLCRLRVQQICCHLNVVELQLWKWMKHEGNYLQYCVHTLYSNI